ncbi:hypothetical protein GCM10023225_23230 [Kineococcus glutinatus]|uniref:Uncharacterized protein n=2 Tax=Kineococcus glutinatus TaxID=1070872 RepID=A0ABP9HZJ8_9ACTN
MTTAGLVILGALAAISLWGLLSSKPGDVTRQQWAGIVALASVIGIAILALVGG